MVYVMFTIVQNENRYQVSYKGKLSIPFDDITDAINHGHRRALASISIGSHISQLTGSGEEWLVINDTVIAKMYDGNLMTDVVGNNDVTI